MRPESSKKSEFLCETLKRSTNTWALMGTLDPVGKRAKRAKQAKQDGVHARDAIVNQS